MFCWRKYPWLVLRRWRSLTEKSKPTWPAAIPHPHRTCGPAKGKCPRAPRIVTVTCSARLDVTSCHWVAHLLIHGLRELIFPVYQVHCTQNNRNDDITIVLPVILLTYHHSLRTFFKVQLGTNADKIFFFFFLHWTVACTKQVWPCFICYLLH